jgi:hypothetical protein
MKNRILKILQLVFIVEITLILLLMDIKLTKINNTCIELKEKTNQIELDYQFLKYNKEQLNEVQYENR